MTGKDDILIELDRHVRMPPKSTTHCWLISDTRYEKFKNLVSLAWDAWAALDHNSEEKLVSDIYQVLNDLGYPDKP